MRDSAQEAREGAEGEGLLPPHDLEAEVATLSACLLDPMAIAKVSDFLRARHFYTETHRQIFAAMESLHAKSLAIDVVSVVNELNARQRLHQVGGPATIASVLNAAPAHDRVRFYGSMVYERWRIRLAIETCQRVAAHGYAGDTADAQAFLDDAATALGELARKSIGAAQLSNTETIKLILEQLRQRSEGEAPAVRGIPYGFPTLDRLTGGMHAGELIFVTALTSVGKTTFAMNVVRHVLELGMGVQVFSTETTRQEYLEAMTSLVGEVDNAIWTTRYPTTAEWSAVMGAMSKLSSWKQLIIDETDAPNVEHVKSACIARAENAVRLDKKPLGLIVVDNLHCMSPPPELARAERHVWLKATAQMLKELAKKLQVPVMLLAQQRDVPIDRNTKVRPRPEKGYVADARQAETFADKSFYLHRLPLHGAGGRVVGEDKTSVVLIPAKARKGASPDVPLKMIPHIGKFIDVDHDSGKRDPMTPASRAFIDKDDDDNPLTRGL